ncbi:MAG: site-2 protease family protein [Treponema sp.]|nr:site-2 protease family protein [Spirochaetia bacterium]MDD7458518.1 site-2 protease family protein [Spirochaetales bacterium]MDY5810950.1 site-2 protease family protein [Treponema sp.]
MTFILGILALGILVFFHELGHFMAARISGVKVEAFSIGMGPVLIHHAYKETDYRISLIPLGGYCAMKGEEDFKKALEQNLKTIEATEDSFYGVHPLKRLFIAFAGPLSNYILGFLAFFIIATMGYSYYSAGNRISMADEVYPELHSAAHEAGLETGDEIIAINKTPVSDFAEIAAFVSAHGDEDLVVKVVRNKETLEFKVHSDIDLDSGMGKIGIVADNTSVVKKEVKGKSFLPAVKEGFSGTLKIISSIKILFKGIKIQNAVSGPARITSMLGSTIQEGFMEGIKTGIISTLEFLAIISVSLFLTNLLPVPVLDGGLILFAFIEWISGRKLSPKLMSYIQYAGIAIIAFMMIFALYGDFLYFFKK